MPTPDPREKSLLLNEALREHVKGRHELERQAGIGDAALRAWEGPLFPLGVWSDAEFGSDEWQQVREEEEDDDDRYVRQKIRGLYFSVADLDLRKSLIEKEREIHGARKEISRAAVFEAEGELAEAKRHGREVFLRSAALALGAVVVGAVFFGVVGAIVGAVVGYSFGHLIALGAVVFGAIFFGIIGAIGGAVVGYFLGYHLIDETTTARQEAVARAEAELKDVKDSYKKVLNKKPIFARSEARTGEPAEAGASVA